MHELGAFSQAGRRRFESGLPLHKAFRICVLGVIPSFGEISVTPEDSIRDLHRSLRGSSGRGCIVSSCGDTLKAKSEDVFRRVFYAYPTIPSPIYDTAARV